MGMKEHTAGHEATQPSSEDVSVEAFEHTDLPADKAGTAADRRDMYRMGKFQELKRNFSFFPIFGFAAVLMISWEAVFSTVIYAIPNGGLPTMVWMYLVVFIGFGAAIICMAEMASIAPTSGGQYHWVSEFAPKATQKIFSYLVGWFCVLGWQSGIASSCFSVALQIQGMIILDNDNYVPKPWHAVLLTIAIVLLIVVFNTFLARHLPLIETILLILHVVGFSAILITLWVVAPRHTSRQVWLDWDVTSGWPEWADRRSHRSRLGSEEVKDASLVIPHAMIWTLVLNGITGFIMMITSAYTLGPIHAAVMPKYNFAFIGTFYYATGSHAGATVMTSIITGLTFCSAIGNLATASRQMFAFARDGGLPFSKVWRYVSPKWDLPMNAITFTCIFTSLLCLINLGSDVAFNAILSIGIVGLLTSYLTSMGCILCKRVRGEALPPRRWSLSPGFGMFCNVLGLAFLAVAFVFAFFPIFSPVTTENFNWASAIYGGVGVLAAIYYLLYARKTYIPPVARLAKDMWLM